MVGSENEPPESEEFETLVNQAELLLEPPTVQSELGTVGVTNGESEAQASRCGSRCGSRPPDADPDADARPPTFEKIYPLEPEPNRTEPNNDRFFWCLKN